MDYTVCKSNFNYTTYTVHTRTHIYRTIKIKFMYTLRPYPYVACFFSLHFSKHILFYFIYLTFFLFVCEIFSIKFELGWWLVCVWECLCVLHTISSVAFQTNRFAWHDEGEIALNVTKMCTILVSSAFFSSLFYFCEHFIATSSGFLCHFHFINWYSSMSQKVIALHFFFNLFVQK